MIRATQANHVLIKLLNELKLSVGDDDKKKIDDALGGVSLHALKSNIVVDASSRYMPISPRHPRPAPPRPSPNDLERIPHLMKDN